MNLQSNITELNLDDTDEVCSFLGIHSNDEIYFQENHGSELVHQIVNKLLSPYDFREFSKAQFTRIAGGSVHSSNKIRNYAVGRGRIKDGYTYIGDIITFCKECIENSVTVPFEMVLQQFKWGEKAVNEQHIPIYSGRKGGKRYDIEAMMDITQGLVAEVAFKIDAERFGWELQLNREFFGSYRRTDQGKDIAKIRENGETSWRDPCLKIQIKNIKYFMLVEQSEFDTQPADIYVAYDTQWQREHTAQQLFRAIGGERIEELFGRFPPLESLRVSRKGWAKRSDFELLESGETYKRQKFKDNNKYVYYNDLRDFSSFPFDRL